MDLTNFSVNNLNKAQKEAVVHDQTPLLILAGAGTGKTLTITMRIAYLIKAGITNPDNILAVTFTNKAANEMKNRITAFVGEDANRMWVGTFHGISAKILRIYASAVGLSPNFTIIDEDDKKKIIQNAMNDLNIDEKRFPIKQITWILQQLRQNCVDPNDSVKLANYDRRDLDVGELYRNYTNRLMSMNLVDFDSLIYLCIVLFRKNPVILSDMQRRFQYITVDEYQDTNFAQHLWLQILASAGANVCCVGDDDQSIYSWRGAYVDYILNFEKDFLGAKIIRLEDNYRSNQSVLNAAMSVISHNKQRYSKELRSGIKSAFEPTLYIVGNDKEEGALLSKHINVLKNNGVNYRNIAVLVRATHQMLNIEDYFIKNKIAYNIIGGIKFYERKEIKDLIAYLQFANTLDNEIASLHTQKRMAGCCLMALKMWQVSAALSHQKSVKVCANLTSSSRTFTTTFATKKAPSKTSLRRFILKAVTPTCCKPRSKKTQPLTIGLTTSASSFPLRRTLTHWINFWSTSLCLRRLTTQKKMTR